MNKEAIIKVLNAAFTAAVCDDFGFNSTFRASTKETKEALKEFGIEANCFEKCVSGYYYAKKYKEENKDKIPTLDEIKDWFKEKEYYELNDKEATSLITLIETI